MKGKIVAPNGRDQYPPDGSIGKVWKLKSGKMAFVPDDLEHLPPDCPQEEFDYYQMEPGEIEIVG